MISTANDRGDKRPRLVEAAAAVFAEKGYASTRVADIAVRAGVGKGTVYEYFSSKDELLFAEQDNPGSAGRLCSPSWIDDPQPHPSKVAGPARRRRLRNSGGLRLPWRAHELGPTGAASSF